MHEKMQAEIHLQDREAMNQELERKVKAQQKITLLRN